MSYDYLSTCNRSLTIVLGRFSIVESDIKTVPLASVSLASRLDWSWRETPRLRRTRVAVPHGSQETARNGSGLDR